jgi:hypothetical protein
VTWIRHRPGSKMPDTIRNAESQRKTRCPKFADDQGTKILELLIKAGPRGVSKAFLIFECHYTQAGARIFELESRGHKIRHEMRPGDRYVTFVLESSREVSKPDPPETGLEDRPRVTGLPLFDLGSGDSRG